MQSNADTKGVPSHRVGLCKRPGHGRGFHGFGWLRETRRLTHFVNQRSVSTWSTGPRCQTLATVAVSSRKRRRMPIASSDFMTSSRGRRTNRALQFIGRRPDSSKWTIALSRSTSACGGHRLAKSSRWITQLGGTSNRAHACNGSPADASPCLQYRRRWTRGCSFEERRERRKKRSAGCDLCDQSRWEDFDLSEFHDARASLESIWLSPACQQSGHRRSGC